MADSVPGEHVDRPAREQAAPALPGVGDETSSTDEVDSAAVLTASAAGAERAPERAVAPVDEVTAGAADAGTPSGAGAATDKVAAHPDGAPASSGPGGSVAGGAVSEPVAAQEGRPDAGAEADAASDGGEAAGSAACAADEAVPDVTEEEDDAAGRSESEADSLKAEGNKLFSKGAAEEALALYEEAIAVAPLRPALAKKRAAYHANRAACLLQLERFEEAIAACDDCLDLDPSYLKAMLRRVTALEKLGMLEEAQQGERRTSRSNGAEAAGARARVVVVVPCRLAWCSGRCWPRPGRTAPRPAPRPKNENARPARRSLLPHLPAGRPALLPLRPCAPQTTRTSWKSSLETRPPRRVWRASRRSRLPRRRSSRRR